MRRRSVVALVAGAAVVLAIGVGLWAFNGPLRQVTITCSTTDTRACSDTEDSLRSDWTFGGGFVFVDPLPAGLVSVDVRPTPPQWNGQEGDWAVLLTFESREPILALCYYTSDDMVGCDPRGGSSPGT